MPAPDLGGRVGAWGRTETRDIGDRNCALVKGGLHSLTETQP